MLFIVHNICLTYGVWVLLLVQLLSAADGSSSKVLLIAVDGFRWDFRDKTDTPHLDELVNNGVTSEYVLNVFPTSTLPNHQSIVTGLYPENHGIIDNSFMDPETGKIFNGLEKDMGVEWWNQSLPIWTVDEMQGHKSGVLFWPGYRVKYKDILPSFLPPDKYSAPYNPGRRKMKVSDRIDMAISWLKKDDVNLVVIYTEEPDDAAHNYSPDSNKAKNVKKLQKAIKSVDDWVKYLSDQLEKENLLSSVNVILIGDHGHVNTTYNHNIHLDDYVDTKKEIRYIGGFTNILIYPKVGRTNCIYDKLKNATSINAHYTVYLKEDIPERLHIKNNSKTADILLLPEPGWTATSDLNDVPFLKGKWERGDHGYSNEHKLMNPAFFAFGPSFRKGYKKKCVNTVDIYNLISYILNIEPSKNDGKFERIKSVLLDFETKEETESEREIIALDCQNT